MNVVRVIGCTSLENSLAACAGEGEGGPLTRVGTFALQGGVLGYLGQLCLGEVRPAFLGEFAHLLGIAIQIQLRTDATLSQEASFQPTDCDRTTPSTPPLLA